MPSGVHVGTFVHGVFEATDFAAADLEAELGRRIDEVQARRAAEVGDRGVVLAGLGAVIETPLGPLLGGARLRDIPRADRLDELDFELPLAGGDVPSGHVDLVVRRGDRFAVVDYKTNWLGPPGEELSAWHYRPDVLAAEMRRSHYVLQALLYTVVLHRFLRWRMPGYDPERNLAGVLYLFLRGMVGSATPAIGDTPCGVFSWRPSAALVTRLSDVLDGRG
jgi:exodeoxyribonuclease V beta subunit